MKAFVAHDPFDKGDRLTVRRPARDRDLQRRFVDGGRAAFRQIDGVDLRDPPVVIARTGRGAGDESFSVRRPIEIVNVQISRRDLADLFGGEVEHRDALIMNRGIDHAGRARRRDQRPAATRAFNVKKGDLLPVRRPMRTRGIAPQRRQLLRIRAIRVRPPELALVVLFARGGKESDGFGIGRPGRIAIDSLAIFSGKRKPGRRWRCLRQAKDRAASAWPWRRSIAPRPRGAIRRKRDIAIQHCFPELLSQFHALRKYDGRAETRREENASSCGCSLQHRCLAGQAVCLIDLPAFPFSMRYCHVR